MNGEQMNDEEKLVEQFGSFLNIPPSDRKPFYSLDEVHNLIAGSALASRGRGYQEGFEAGEDQGYDRGRGDGRRDGYKTGFGNGWLAGINDRQEPEA